MKCTRGAAIVRQFCLITFTGMSSIPGAALLGNLLIIVMISNTSVGERNKEHILVILEVELMEVKEWSGIFWQRWDRQW